MEITGGLAQVLPLPRAYELETIDAGHSLVQLKRAFRGAAFVRGALFLLRGEKALEDACHALSSTRRTRFRSRSSK